MLHFNKIVVHLPRKTDEAIEETMLLARNSARAKLRANTQGDGDLAMALHIDKKTSEKSTTFSLRVIGPPSKYASAVDTGFQPHVVSVADKPKLINWIRRNLGDDAAMELIMKNHMRVGEKTPWNPRGVRFMDAANKTRL